MKSGTAAEQAYDRAYKFAQTHKNSKRIDGLLKEAKRQGGSVGRAVQKGIAHANGRNR